MPSITQHPDTPVPTPRITKFTNCRLPLNGHLVLPSLGPSGGPRRAEDGAESLGAHVEGPFLSPGKNGIHSPSVLLAANTGFQDLIDCYGAENLLASQDVPSSAPITPTTTSTSTSASSASTTRSNPTANIKMITAAPEVGIMNTLIPTLVSHNIIYSIGHSDATYEQALDALAAGASMITHLFNAMRPFYHRHPGIFGLLAQQSQQATRPFYGLIADGIHLHPTSVQIAYHAHPAGMVLVTDAMKLCGMPDGVYEWTNGERIIKRGALLTLEGSAEGKIAGSSATLIECVNNFRRWAGTGVVEAVRAVTETPARMLGLEGVKGVLVPGADADLVVLGEDAEGTLTVDQVWKFGVRVFDCVKDAQWAA
ncbi:conserved hypothetical protein [Histoplasma mississippiense (nom. inval.)]|uniref:conserved hypothetical protein n=1 Tax=Ajellomyces capsulatus (strain NAm1 / WU24) TaxID=2059318 RepID=UPI000157D347|nr:conserved hypothetical protein [Histoplasma mississippiense (nom. inval.)]EDN04493.1 conserved hypothetical protein [Histoplasma mississippiense (nom. inval.)]